MNPLSQREQEKKPGPAQKYSDEFRREALERMKTCDSISALARELGVRRKWLYKWRDLAQSGRVPAAVGRPPKAKMTAEEKDRKRIAELERLVARQALEIDFFKGALQRIEEHRRKREQTSGAASTSRSGE